MEDYGYLFEKVVEHFIGKPNTPIYFANYYGDNFATKALLFSICVKEQNCNPEAYSEQELKKLSEFENILSSLEVKHNNAVECIKLLADKIKQ